MDEDYGESYAEYMLIEYSVKVGDATYKASCSITEGQDSTFAYQQLKDVVSKQVNAAWREYQELQTKKKCANELLDDHDWFESGKGRGNSQHLTHEQALREAEGMEVYE